MNPGFIMDITPDWTQVWTAAQAETELKDFKFMKDFKFNGVGWYKTEYNSEYGTKTDWLLVLEKYEGGFIPTVQRYTFSVYNGVEHSPRATFLDIASLPLIQ